MELDKTNQEALLDLGSVKVTGLSQAGYLVFTIKAFSHSMGLRTRPNGGILLPPLDRGFSSRITSK